MSKSPLKRLAPIAIVITAAWQTHPAFGGRDFESNHIHRDLVYDSYGHLQQLTAYSQFC
jgi:hypothetical protein